MASETFVLTALPHSAAAGADFHVSLHIAPRLVPGKGEGTLASFARFKNWGERAANATWRLTDEADRPIPALVLTDRIQPPLWPEVFSETTPVRGPRFDAMKNRDWRSFPAKAAHDLAVATALYGTLLFPTQPPVPPRHQRGMDDRWLKMLMLLDDEEQATKLLDSIAADPKKAHDQPLLRSLATLQQVRRFYERPEAQRPRHDSPVDGLAHQPLDRPKPDFHERVAHLADQPAMLRRLGLVIDVRVTDLKALGRAKSLRATMVASNGAADKAAIRSTTPLLRPGGDRLLTKPRTKDWRDGKLLLGGDDYEVLTLDTDGSALKLERYLRALPRIFKTAWNSDAVTAAPPAQRAEGFTIARTGREKVVRGQMAGAAAMQADVVAGTAPEVRTEDVTRGYRVEIWDDFAKAWFSPHLRRSTAWVAGATAPVYADRLEYGAIQAAGVSEVPQANGQGSVYLHEAVFGWSGWSLSAPRPGPRAVPNGRKEDLLPAPRPGNADAGEPPVTPVLVETRVEPGTLPRLRYGRSYAFRAWSVDLAGNSPGDPLILAPLEGGGIPPRRRNAVEQPRQEASLRQPRLAANQMPDVARAADRVATRLGRIDLNEAASGLATLDAPEAALPRLTGVAQRDREIARTLRLRAARRGVAAPTAAGVGPAELLRGALDRVTLEQGVAGGVAQAIDTTVTPLMPFRRWDPVPPPVVVARHRFSMAESVNHMVIRSGVAPAEGEAPPIVAAPADYIAQVTEQAGAKAAEDWRATSERHLAAPKGSQHLNELHGRFDAALEDPAQARLLLATALREDGTFFDRTVVDLSDPRQTLPQPGVSIEAMPEVAEPRTEFERVTGENRGEPLDRNHYVVHDTDRLRLPYLPDPLAAGVALGMADANRDSPLMGAFRVESTGARYGGAWPEPEPMRLVLESAPSPTARVADGVITIGLPPGGRLDLNLSSLLERDDLPLFALWNLLPAELRAIDPIERPAADGQFWALTPPERISLVHAVPRPVLAPLVNWLLPSRSAGATHADLLGAADIHAASTDRIDLEASWWEWRDDPTMPEPLRERHFGPAMHATVRADEDLVLLGGDVPDDYTAEVSQVGRVPVHRARHEFGDTRHRLVEYRMRATTRFREYFPLSLMRDAEDRSQLSAPVEVSLASTARPPAPRVHSVLPLFRWDEDDAIGQPFGVRRRRRTGLRIYLERPWFQSGDGEKLAVIFGTKDHNDAAHVSVWGSDPLWVNQGPPDQYVGLAVEDAFTAVDMDPVRGHDSRVGPAATVRLEDVPGKPNVSILAYEPEFSAERCLWFVDVALEPAAAVWPFVRLAVARYQPDALAGLRLSPVVLTDFCQLPPERTMTVSRPDDRSARITVSGPIGLRASQILPPPPPPVGTGPVVPLPAPTAPSPDLSANYPLGKADITNVVARDRRVFAVLEHRDAEEASDLAWRAVRRKELSIGGVSPEKDWAWTGVLDLPEPVALAEPGGAGEWRITVEEHEGLDADPADPNTSGPLTKAWRIIYADRTSL